MTERPWLKSYPEGVPETLAPYPDRPLYSFLEEAAAAHPGNVATSFFGKKTTYAELVKQVDQFSRALTSLGVEKGDRVALVLPNSPQYVVAAYACARIGALFVGTNPLYTKREMIHQLNDCGAEVCVVLDTLYHAVGPVRDQTPLRTVIVTKLTGAMPFFLSRLAPFELKREAKKHDEPWPPVPKDADVVRWEQLMREDLPAAPPAEIDSENDLAALVYTGGTTGLAKGAMLTNANLARNAMQSAAWFPGLRDGGESVMCVLPFFHSYGMTVCMNLGIMLGAKLVLVPRFELKRVLKTVQKEKPTLFPGVPRLYVSINESKETPKYDLRSITACLSGAAPLPAAVAEKFERITGGNLVEGYGLTETSPVTHANPVLGTRRPGTIGLPISDTDCRVVELGDWTMDVPPGEPGQMVIAGPQVMKGYWNRPEETELVLKHDADGRPWLLSGDVAVMDEEGYFSIVDRMKDMIIVSGFNVYPTEVEDVVHRHPKVLQVSVIGVPDERTGEAVKAFIVLREGEKPGVTVTEKDIIDFAGDPENGLSRYRVPKQIEFRNSLPETMIGKVLRRVLVAEERERAKAATRDPAV
jgi:long-chain acyl-CoA synthetase